jgi:PAS domain S-box-containing protein
MDRAVVESVCARLFGSGADRIEDVWVRASAEADSPIVWEGDAQTFQFSFVSPNAQAILGHPTQRWLDEPAFWATSIIHPDDREEAVAYCALATAKRADHTFEYRALRADGSVVWLLDVVRVVVGPRGLPERLRGLMFDISATRCAVSDSSRAGALVQQPTREELARLPA